MEATVPPAGLAAGACALFNGYALGFAKGKIFTGPTKGICVPVLNCYSCPGALGACPIGALQTAIGGQRGHFPFYVLGMLVLFGVLLAGAYAGCCAPLGWYRICCTKSPAPKPRCPGG